jgi:preprotein translocase subunit YajC
MWTDLVYAMAPSGQGGGGQQSPLNLIVMMGVIFAIFYFLLIRPQQKRQRQHREMLANLKEGDTVVTTGGLIGRIVSLTDSVVTLELADRIRVKVMRSQISGLSNPSLLEAGGSRKSSRK